MNLDLEELLFFASQQLLLHFVNVTKCLIEITMEGTEAFIGGGGCMIEDLEKFLFVTSQQKACSLRIAHIDQLPFPT